MRISVVNHTNGKLSDEQVQEGIRAVNRQIAFDFKPHWHISAELRLEGAVGDDPDKKKIPELRGDAVVYLWNDADVEDALGYHEANALGVPFGFIFTDVVADMGEPWTTTFSHEALELLGDAQANRLVAGPHPADPNKEVFHWYEMCDAVQDEIYKIDDIPVSNFLLPLYFTPVRELGGRNDFLGRLHKKRALESFGINPGGYIGFFNPESGQHETFALKGDKRAKARLEAKGRVQLTRRSTRYKTGINFRVGVDRLERVSRRRRERAERPSASRGVADAQAGRECELIDSSPRRPELGK